LIQQYHFPLLDSIMTAITVIGAEEFYMVLVCFLLWSRHHHVGVRLSVWLAVAGFVNADLKNIFAHPRPFQLDPSVQLIATSGYGLPSGHAQVATVVWGYLASHSSEARYRWAAFAAVFLIGFSRIYLGVHFPSDVLAGWVVGLFLLLFCLVSEPLLVRFFRSFGRFGRISLAIGVPVLLAVVYPLAGSARALGMAAGLTSGYLTVEPVKGDASAKIQSIRFLVGISGLLALRIMGGTALSLLPNPASPEFIVVSFLVGALLGFWASAGAPLLFRFLGLKVRWPFSPS